MFVSIEKKAAEVSASSNSLKNIWPPEGSVEKAEGARFSPSNVFPLLKTKEAVKEAQVS
jgi:hypothetical protein